jgi:hypothetical protein
MKKKLLAVMLMICAVFLFSACQPINFTPANFSIENLTNISIGVNVTDLVLDEDDTIPPEEDNINDDINVVIGDDPVDVPDVEIKPPELSGNDVIPTKMIKEGEFISLKKNLAIDPDGDSIQYLFTEPFDVNGEWQTEVGDAGEYVINVTASDGELASLLQIRIIVDAINKAPVISNFNDITIDEGEVIVLKPAVVDPEGEEVTTAYSGWMTQGTRNTGFDDEGEYKVTLTASDGTLASAKTIVITILNINRAPRLESLDSMTVTEGDIAVLRPVAVDSDGDTVKFSFSEPFDMAGKWVTSEGDAATYNIIVTASDGELQDTETAMIKVVPANDAPTIAIADKISVYEGETVELNPDVTDPNNDKVTVTYSGWMTTPTRETTFNDEGEYEVVITADDGTTSVTKTVTIVVNNLNRAPVFVDEVFE